MRLRPTELIRVGKGAQEQFLEYAHYLPERSVQATVERNKLAAFAALDGRELTEPISVDQVRIFFACNHGIACSAERAHWVSWPLS